MSTQFVCFNGAVLIILNLYFMNLKSTNIKGPKNIEIHGFKSKVIHKISWKYKIQTISSERGNGFRQFGQSQIVPMMKLIIAQEKVEKTLKINSIMIRMRKLMNA